MNLNPEHPEIDHRTLKLLVGLIALSLASITSYFAEASILSISESYHVGGWSQTFFIGSLFSVAAFLLAYNGLSAREWMLGKVASLAALGVALFPCGCKGHDEILPNVHGASAAVLFLMLAGMCWIFFHRAMTKGHAEARRRAAIYAVCGVAMLASIAVLLIDHALDEAWSGRPARLTFYGEAVALFAFGISWLTASRVLPGLTDAGERFWPASARPARD